MSDLDAPSKSASIHIARRGPVAVLRMTHGRANALDVELLHALRHGLASIADSDAKAVVLTGSGAIFSAGVDLPRLLDGGRAYLESFLPELSSCLRELLVFSRPVIAAINGHAIAGGYVMACACDRRVMARGPALCGVPELRVGVPFPLVALEIMRFALPPGLLSEAVLMGRNYGCDAALDRGMVDELVEPERLEARALEVAEELASIPAASFARTKQDLRRPLLETLALHCAEHDRAMLEAWGSEPVRAAVRAFIEKTLRKRA